MEGTEVKAMIKQAGLKCWQVADAWGLCDSNFSRKLRKPFSEEDVQRLREIITTLSEGKKKRKRLPLTFDEDPNGKRVTVSAILTRSHYTTSGAELQGRKQN